MLNTVVMMGRLTADPELKKTQNDVAVCSFRIAVDRDHKKDDGTRDTDFLTCVAWKATAEFVAKYFRKGEMIAVEGAIQTRSYDDKDGNKRSVTEVVVAHAYFCGDKRERSEPSSPKGFDTAGFVNTAVDEDGLPF